MVKSQAFLSKNDDESIEIVKGWPNNGATFHKQTTLTALHAKIQFGVSLCLDDQGYQYGEDDFVICKRNEVVEIWTNREFTPHEIVFLPETTLCLEKSWVQGRAALVNYDITCHVCIQIDFIIFLVV